MKNSAIYYSVGPLLYCPANNKSVAKSIISEKFGKNFSLALCLEDTINDKFVYEAERIMINSISEIYKAREKQSFYLPKIFIRVRNAQQLTRLRDALKDSADIISGFIIPKFSLETADEYIQTIIKINEFSKKSMYVMPIYESSTIIDKRTRCETLYELKDKLSNIEELVLNIRVGGNDLCHVFGFRRHKDESIHKIRPIADIFSDIITVYGTDYVISGPVWEYYKGDGWKKGLKNEIKDDKLCGFIGKTIIHPNQIKVVNSAYKVSKQDYDDAKAILNWKPTAQSMVTGNSTGERMNEQKTHSNWANQIIMLKEAYGI